jgi:hypothetical protein
VTGQPGLCFRAFPGNPDQFRKIVNRQVVLFPKNFGNIGLRQVQIGLAHLTGNHNSFGANFQGSVIWGRGQPYPVRFFQPGPGCGPAGRWIKIHRYCGRRWLRNRTSRGFPQAQSPIACKRRLGIPDSPWLWLLKNIRGSENFIASRP